MSRTVTLARFLIDYPRLAIEQQSIHRANSRARASGKRLPHPYVISRGQGVPALVDLDAARAWAAAEGKSHIFEGGRGR